MKIIAASLSVFVLFPRVSSAQDPCSLCPSGVNLVDPELVLPGDGPTITCGALSGYAATISNSTSEECLALQNAYVSFVRGHWWMF